CTHALGLKIDVAPSPATEPIVNLSGAAPVDSPAGGFAARTQPETRAVHGERPSHCGSGDRVHPDKLPFPGGVRRARPRVLEGLSLLVQQHARVAARCTELRGGAVSRICRRLRGHDRERREYARGNERRTDTHPSSRHDAPPLVALSWGDALTAEGS